MNALTQHPRAAAAAQPSPAACKAVSSRPQAPLLGSARKQHSALPSFAKQQLSPALRGLNTTTQRRSDALVAHAAEVGQRPTIPAGDSWANYPPPPTTPSEQVLDLWQQADAVCFDGECGAASGGIVERSGGREDERRSVGG